MSREKFEAWVSDNGKWPTAILRKNGTYVLMQTQQDWQAWQAAMAEQSEQLTAAKHRIAELEKDCDILAQNHEADRREIERLKSALSGMLGIVADSQGVAGYHLNGEIAEWDEFEEIDAAYEALKGAE